MIAEQIEKLQVSLSETQEALHAAEREREQARTDLRLSKQREAELAAELSTKTGEWEKLRQQLAKAQQLERRIFDAEQGGLTDRQRSSSLERELAAKSEALRLTGGELDASKHTEEALRASLHDREAELVSVRADFASAAGLLDALRLRAQADKTIAAESRKLKLGGDGDGG